MVLNDKAHHCYRDKPDDRIAEDLDADEKAEAKQREEEARVWFKGLQRLHAKLGINTVYDLSATPFFLTGFRLWDGSDIPVGGQRLSLIDAIECGIVKVPRLPVDDGPGRDGRVPQPVGRDRRQPAVPAAGQESPARPFVPGASVSVAAPTVGYRSTSLRKLPT